MLACITHIRQINQIATLLKAWGQTKGIELEDTIRAIARANAAGERCLSSALQMPLQNVVLKATRTLHSFRWQSCGLLHFPMQLTIAVTHKSVRVIILL